MAITDPTLLATHISDALMNYKATVWQGTVKTTGIVSAVTSTTITVAGTAITKANITAIESGPF